MTRPEAEAMAREWVVRETPTCYMCRENTSCPSCLLFIGTFADVLERVAREAREEGIREAAKAVDGKRLIGRGSIGPLWDIGWGHAVKVSHEAILALLEPKPALSGEGEQP